MGLLVVAYPHISRLINEQITEAKVYELQEGWEGLTEQEREHQIEEAEEHNADILERGGLGVDLGEIDFTDSNSEGGVVAASTSSTNNEDYVDDGGAGEGLEGSLNGPVSEVYASIEIPKLSLNLPIYLNTSRWALARGVGQVTGASLPIGGESTHTVLAGHRGMATQQMFQHLDRLNEGDEFIIHSINGPLRYRVYDTQVILPHQTGGLEIVRGKDLASLVTCHPYGANTHRLIVQGERVN